MTRTRAPLHLDAATVIYSRPRKRSPTEALRNASLTLEPGRIVGLVGGNGAGKTTLLEVAVGAIRPTSGEVRWFGRTAWDRPTRRRIGFCPDVPAIPGALGVRRSLELFATLKGASRIEGRRKADRAIERLDLGPVAGRRNASLSRGNLVRVGIAQALLDEPDLLLLDESFAPLDPPAQRRLRKILREERRRGAAVLLSSHQLDQVGMLSDGVVLMDRGRVSAEVDPRKASASLETLLLGFTEDEPGCTTPRLRPPPR